MVQTKFETGMYIVDENFRILNINDTMKALYPSVKIGDICYKSIALQQCQCTVCPLMQDDALFYNPLRKQWVSANAAVMDYPGRGRCYNVQFHIRHNISDAAQEALQEENMDEHILELSGGSLDACAIGSYLEAGAPISYVNESMVRLMGYGSVDEMHRAVDGLVFNTIHPEDVEHVAQDLTECGLHGGSFETTYRLRRKDGSWLWVVARGKRVQSASGVYTLLCVITEMTQLMQQQSEFTRRQTQFDIVALNVPCGYHRCTVDNGFCLEFVSNDFLDILGYEHQDEVLGKPFMDFVAPEDRDFFMEHEPVLAREGKVELVYRILCKDGTRRWIKDATMRIQYDGKDTYQCILADITEHVESLNEAKAQAEASSQAKSAFLFNASHDIRTPMNAIQGFAHIIKENVHNPELVLQTVEKLQRSGDVLMTLLDDVLELSRIEQGKDNVNLRPLNMGEHAEKLHEMMVQEMEASGITFRMENQIQHPMVMADDLKLTRIAMNYLSNARKFTSAGGAVNFGVVESDFDGSSAVYTLYVEDTGIGMSREFQEHAFEQFERERTATVSGVTGSGLGLSITRRLAELLGGSCRIESELGKGTRALCSVRLGLAEENEQWPVLEEVLPDFTGMRVLLVEDNDFNREIARYVFEGIGLEVEEAVDGVACLEKLTTQSAGYFDFVLMDIQMPVMDGYRATEEIRRLPDSAAAKIPIIAMTANAFDEDKRRCLAVGMDGHVAKPMDIENVMKELTRVLRKGGSEV